MQIVILIFTFFLACGTKTTQTTNEKPTEITEKTDTKDTNAPELDTLCLGVDCVEGATCVKGECISTVPVEVNTIDKSQLCAKIDCMDGHRCVDGQCIANDTTTKTTDQVKPDRCHRITCPKDTACREGRCQSTLRVSTEPDVPFFDACGCGCCGSKPMNETCIENKEDFEKQRALVREQQKNITPQGCQDEGCSMGMRYKLCLPETPSK